MAAPTQFEGWLGKSPDAINGKMEWGSYEPKKWTEDDVDIEISHCGVCGSDLHALRSGWKETPYPCVVGHEIVGKAIRVGNNVKHIKVGDRVGVGAHSRSCQRSNCVDCSTGNEVYCANQMTDTYASHFPGDEGKSYGGYADYNRVNGHWAFLIPEGLDSALAAPMLCGGVTVYSPLKRNGCGPGKTVGIVGVGGLGHFAILFAKALGADRVVGISRKAGKKEEVLKLGADEYIATDDDKDWAAKNRRSLDLIISTVSNAKMPLMEYFSLLKARGTYIQLGVPDGGELPPISAFSLIINGIKVGGSMTGTPSDIREMLQLAADKKIKPWVQERSLRDANQTIVDMLEGKARFRYVLVNENFGRH
ncbi:zinc-binding dehydrogenase [Biscogniauxia marginata]|nr:zinc-binding dehydrogenase [Biscogniauxia marginata]